MVDAVTARLVDYTSPQGSEDLFDLVEAAFECEPWQATPLTKDAVTRNPRFTTSNSELPMPTGGAKRWARRALEFLRIAGTNRHLVPDFSFLRPKERDNAAAAYVKVRRVLEESPKPHTAWFDLDGTIFSELWLTGESPYLRGTGIGILRAFHDTGVPTGIYSCRTLVQMINTLERFPELPRPMQQPWNNKGGWMLRSLEYLENFAGRMSKAGERVELKILDDGIPLFYFPRHNLGRFLRPIEGGELFVSYAMQAPDVRAVRQAVGLASPIYEILRASEIGSWTHLYNDKDFRSLKTVLSQIAQSR